MRHEGLSCVYDILLLLGLDHRQSDSRETPNFKMEVFMCTLIITQRNPTT